jgi:hypothetical protein
VYINQQIFCDVSQSMATKGEGMQGDFTELLTDKKDAVSGH